MQLGWQLSAATLALALGTAQCQVQEPGIFNRLRAAVTNTFDDAFYSFKSCSCDCCEAAALQKQEYVWSPEKAAYDTFHCEHPKPATEDCPEMCIARDRNSNLQSNQNVEPGAALDYTRYCHHQCNVVSMINGGACKSANDTSRDASGGKLTMHKAEEPPSGWNPGVVYQDQGQSQEQVQKAVEAKAEAQAEAQAVEMETQRNVTWDMRKVIAERLRAEAGAANARAAFSLDRAKLHSHAIGRSNNLLRKAKQAAAEESASFQPDFLEAKKTADAAGDSATETFNTLKKAKAKLRSIGTDTREMARKLIKEAAAGPAKEEAKAYAKRMNWDKQNSFVWEEVQKAALPYVTAVSKNVERSAEYKRAAEAVEEKERALKVQLDIALTDAETLKKNGDRIGAANEHSHANVLRNEVEDADLLAKKYRKTGDSALEAAKQWQEAAYNVTGHVNSLFASSGATTQPPPPVLGVPVPPGVFR